MIEVTLQAIIDAKIYDANEMRMYLARGIYSEPDFVQGLVDLLDAEVELLAGLHVKPDSMLSDASAFSTKYMRGKPDLNFLMARLAKLNEELSEFATGAVKNDDTEIADALVDIVYVALVTSAKMGYPFAELWASVHASNMTRTPKGEYQASKGEDFIPNDVAAIMERHGF